VGYEELSRKMYPVRRDKLVNPRLVISVSCSEENNVIVSSDLVWFISQIKDLSRMHGS